MIEGGNGNGGHIYGGNVYTPYLNNYTTISGGGSIEQMNHVWNDTNGVIQGNSLQIGNVGTIYNYGLIEALGSGGMALSSFYGVWNDGTLEADGGALTVSGHALYGTGQAVVTNGGQLLFSVDFQQNVTFQGTGAGELELYTQFTSEPENPSDL
jgi:hypothetical protein